MKLLQKKIGSKSAGRVQSVALKLIVDREKEIDAFNKVEYWEMYLNFTKKAKKYKAILTKKDDEKLSLTSKNECEKIEENLGTSFLVEEVNFKEKEKASKPPFTTSTLQQEASSKLNFQARKTMQVAQTLYEGIDIKNERVGLITYMRTDSVRLSDEFISSAKEYITKNYGKEYYQGYKKFDVKAKNIQDAHEAIRPSNLKYTPDSVKDYLTSDELKLYTIIYDRAVASLMTNAKVEQENVVVNNNGYKFELNGERVLFDGYMIVSSKYEDDDSKSLPEFKEGEVLKSTSLEKIQKFTNPPLRYNEARLIKKMEELGIGRPSTYAVTIDTLKTRGYAKLEKKNFVPTNQGKLTMQKLEEYFSSVINIKYTADMEKNLDDISEGKMVWSDEVSKFYSDYKPVFDKAEASMERMYPIETDELCPECGSKLLIRNGRFGEFLACSGFPKCHYTAKKEIPEEPVSTGIKCPHCEDGYIVERLSKKGRSAGQKFYACNNYPKCKTTYSSLDEIK